MPASSHAIVGAGYRPRLVGRSCHAWEAPKTYRLRLSRLTGSWSVETRGRNRILYDVRVAGCCTWGTACSTTFAFSDPTGWLVYEPLATGLCETHRPTEPHTEGEFHLSNKTTGHKRGRI